MRFAVCEDNEIHRELLIHQLNCWAVEHSLSLDPVPYECGMNLLHDVEEGKYFDAVFLDIFLGDGMGNQLARKLRESGYREKIVFTTASPDYAIEGYDVDASGYLLKPLNQDKLSSLLTKIAEESQMGTYQFRYRSVVTNLPYNEILFVESCNSKCMIHTLSGNVYVIYKTLSCIETELKAPCFLRCHQSFIVNMDHVKQMSREFVLISGDVIPIRQRGLKQVRDAYMEYSTSRDTENR